MSTEALKLIGSNSRKLCMEKYSWDKTAKVFERIFDNIDINNKLDWSSPKRSVAINHNLSADKNHRKLIYNIIDHIIKEPYLKDTNFVQQLVKNANEGYLQYGQKSIPFGINNYLSILETYAKNKISLETLRTTGSSILSNTIQDFINYSKQ
jgi:hypothetical protein